MPSLGDKCLAPPPHAAAALPLSPYPSLAHLSLSLASLPSPPYLVTLDGGLRAHHILHQVADAGLEEVVLHAVLEQGDLERLGGNLRTRHMDTSLVLWVFPLYVSSAT